MGPLSTQLVKDSSKIGQETVVRPGRLRDFESDSYTRQMRVRSKACEQCEVQKEVLYRCRYRESKDWVFLCATCLKDVKATFTESYQYGGTWKSKKK